MNEKECTVDWTWSHIPHYAISSICQTTTIARTSFDRCERYITTNLPWDATSLPAEDRERDLLGSHPHISQSAN
ncbi:hypothetical protein RSAG8_10207, partial [Rhizoctonia solani AG-8 WAC10335]